LNENNNDVGVAKGQVVSCFALSRTPVDNELQQPPDSKRGKAEIASAEDAPIPPSPASSRMRYVEFLELVCRVAVCKFYDTEQEYSLSLSQKVLCVLDDLFESAGVQATDPTSLPLPS